MLMCENSLRVLMKQWNVDELLLADNGCDVVSNNHLRSVSDSSPCPWEAPPHSRSLETSVTLPRPLHAALEEGPSDFVFGAVQCVSVFCYFPLDWGAAVRARPRQFLSNTYCKCFLCSCRWHEAIKANSHIGIYLNTLSWKCFSLF